MKHKNEWKKFVKNSSLKMDILNVIMGFIVLILFVIVIIQPYNLYAMIGLSIVAGTMNLMNGYRHIENQSKMRKTFYKVIGFVLLAYGMYLIKAKFII